MSDYVTLLGAEQVQRAASQMQQAADTMQKAASSIEYSVDRMERLYAEFVSRMEQEQSDD